MLGGDLELFFSILKNDFQNLFSRERGRNPFPSFLKRVISSMRMDVNFYHPSSWDLRSVWIFPKIFIGGSLGSACDGRGIT